MNEDPNFSRLGEVEAASNSLRSTRSYSTSYLVFSVKIGLKKFQQLELLMRDYPWLALRHNSQKSNLMSAIRTFFSLVMELSFSSSHSTI